MRRAGRALTRLVVLLIRAYQGTVGPMLGPRCRFYPSCSEYAVQAIQARGLLRGGLAATWRLLRCGPWSRGGLDPAPRPRAVRVGSG